jgi:NAD(P)-dependent dehydrogenase (short-subunit alcohol dehydrogenase family)
MAHKAVVQPKLCTLITGSSSGIGRQLAVHLSQNRSLILHGRDVTRLTETESLCAHQGSHFLWALDLCDPGKIETALRELLTTANVAIDCFIHSAGILRLLPMRAMDLKTSHEMMAVNFFAAAEIIRLLLKRQVNYHQLRNVIFISSTASKFGAKGFNLYCASKGALDSLMRALAVELAPDVRVNSILPGGIRTPMTEAMFNDPQLACRLARDYPLGVGQASDVAAAVEFLLSEKARWITGLQMIVDGGRTINISA